MSKQAKNALLIGLAVTITSFVLVRLFVRRYENTLSGGQEARVLVVVREVQRGQTLAREDLAVREVPLAFVDGREVRSQDLEQVIGVETVSRIKAQEGLMWSDLAIEPGDRQVTRLIVPGKRAVPFLPYRVGAAEEFVRPGDYVDVIATVDDNRSSASVVLLQRVIVLAVGAKTEREPPGDPDQVRARGRQRIVTLSLDLREAQLLALAQDQTQEISLVIRHPDDLRLQHDVPALAAKSLVEAPKAAIERKSSISRRSDSARRSDSPPQALTEAH